MSPRMSGIVEKWEKYLEEAPDVVLPKGIRRTTREKRNQAVRDRWTGKPENIHLLHKRHKRYAEGVAV